MSNELNLDHYVPAAGGVTMFTTSWCGYCRNLKRLMDQKGVAYTEVNIEEVEGTAEIVEAFNNGNQTVPTLIFPDGTAATNPRIDEVVERVGA
ncbi:mycoredoxin [Arthrobacter sp. JUb119]|uniref:glutaredoxin domain-containing protein n=1 Tax=unclassified Glutamicibacter TaxID=2627139 RepID=UPI002A287322|nr:mycoredoxin [Arthrobacter sp. JUb119]